MGLRRRKLAAMLLMAWWTLGCSGGGADGDAEPTVEPVVETASPRIYEAVWLIDAESVGADGPGFPYRYVEVVDDRAGRYLVQSPNHLATQSRDEVVFCAAIFRSDPYCAATERPEDTPAVLAYPLQLLRTWGPTQLYDLASRREIAFAAATEPDAWSQRKDVVRDIAVECWQVIDETAAAPIGFEICFTDDDIDLVASVDLQGDLVYEIDLIGYERRVGNDAFETGLDEFIEAKPSLQDQLIMLFPDIPAARPTPTPAPADE